MDGSATKPPGRGEKLGIAFFFLSAVLFGAVVEYRSAFLSRRMGDLDVFLRAAWAVRTDADLYLVTSDNDWHYLYPPLYAILLTPLADPPRGADAAGYVPYPLSVVILYAVNLVVLLLGVHVLANALEKHSADRGFAGQPPYCRRWWRLRLWPVLICLLPIAHTLMRGQSNVIVLGALCAALAGWIRGQSFRAGAWLALAICIKVIPVYLLVYPLWRRDGRALAGCGLGCVVGLVVVPALVFGPTRCLAHYETYARVFFGPLLQLNDDSLVKNEMLGVNATDSIGVKNALHNWMYPERDQRPEAMHPGGKALYFVLGCAMTFLTLRPRMDTTLRIAQGLGGLIVLMAIFSPVCHSHYLLFCVPIVMCLLAECWQNQTMLQVPLVLVICFAAFVAIVGIAYLPGLETLKDRCVGLLATLPLWAIPILGRWHRKCAVVGHAARVPA